MHKCLNHELIPCRAFAYPFVTVIMDVLTSLRCHYFFTPYTHTSWLLLEMPMSIPQVTDSIYVVVWESKLPKTSQNAHLKTLM
ncbi:hypothetical protein GDO86_001856 [Hymenochirus boettgeri]|uniref:Uncharacterized protein n=1 Tax=Hymenochirus boettgeri TaxID=247094 RepID=A0A8T2KIS4_9PIPI|nr:hypothetical protein GDO86_001856 [Hymenochirus boettgeri]